MRAVNDSHPHKIITAAGTILRLFYYLTKQLVELGIPVVLAINMMDVVKKEKAAGRSVMTNRI